MQAQVTGDDPERRGNVRPGLCPHDVYPCRPDGLWVAIAVRDDDDWQRLCAAIERPDLAADAALATVAGREAQRATGRRRGGGVDGGRATGHADRGARCRPPACPPRSPPDPSELAVDEQLWSRGFFRILERPEVGTHPFPGPVVGLDARRRR